MKKILLPGLHKKKVIDPNKIIYFEADGKYSKVYLSNSKNYLICKCLKELDTLFNINSFCRIHRKYIINLHYLEEFSLNGKCIVRLKKGIKLPIAYRRKKEVYNSILDFFNS